MGKLPLVTEQYSGGGIRAFYWLQYLASHMNPCSPSTNLQRKYWYPISPFHR